MKFEPLTLENAGDGALQAEFEAGLEQLLADLDDPQKSPTAERALTLKITLKPAAEDNRIDVTIASTTRLPARRPVGTMAVRDGDGILQYRNTQQELPLEKVTPFPQTPNEEEGA